MAAEETWKLRRPSPAKERRAGRIRSSTVARGIARRTLRSSRIPFSTACQAKRQESREVGPPAVAQSSLQRSSGLRSAQETSRTGPMYRPP